MTNLLHIGLGKCASTFLQREIFPILAKKTNSNFINFNDNNFFKIKKNIKFHPLEEFNNIESLLPNNYIFSREDLFSYEWEFSRIFESFELIKKNFSANTVILLVIRNPYDLLNSIYAQSIHELRIINPENFFYIEKNQTHIRLGNKFNLYNFDYEKLISLYKNYFKKVVVVKFEDLFNYKFLDTIYDLDEDFINLLKKRRKVYNKSVSKTAIKFILFLNKFFDVKSQQEFIKKFINPKSNDLKSKILRIFLFRRFFQDKFDRLYPYESFKIDKNKIPIDIDKEILKYDKLDF